MPHRVSLFVGRFYPTGDHEVAARRPDTSGTSGVALVHKPTIDRNMPSWIRRRRFVDPALKFPFVMLRTAATIDARIPAIPVISIALRFARIETVLVGIAIDLTIR